MTASTHSIKAIHKQYILSMFSSEANIRKRVSDDFLVIENFNFFCNVLRLCATRRVTLQT